MEIPLQITLRGVAHSDAVEAAIRDKTAKLEQFHPRITACRVVVEVPGRHHYKGKEYVVSIDIKVPGGEIVVDRDHSEDVYVALRDAFDAARRKLDDHARVKRGEVKSHLR